MKRFFTFLMVVTLSLSPSFSGKGYARRPNPRNGPSPLSTKAITRGGSAPPEVYLGPSPIAGVIADVLVTQVYRNEGRDPLEELYVFRPSPGPRCTG